MIGNGGDADNPYSYVPSMEELCHQWNVQPQTQQEQAFIEQFRDRVYRDETFFTEAMVFPMVLNGRMGACTILSTRRAAQIFKDNSIDAGRQNLITRPYWTQWEVWHAPGVAVMTLYNGRAHGQCYGTLEHVMDNIFCPTPAERLAWRERYCMLLPGPGLQHKSYLRQLIYEKAHTKYIHEIFTGLSQHALMGIDLYTRITTLGGPIEPYQAHWVLNISKPPFQRPYVKAMEWWKVLDWTSYGQAIPPNEWDLGPVKYTIARNQPPGSML